jgi:ATP-binding cassette, subfamily C, bacterial
VSIRLRYLRRLKIKLAVGMSSRFLWHILRLLVSFYAQRFAGEISNRTTLNDQVADVLAGRLAATVIDTFVYGLWMDISALECSSHFKV